MIHFEAKQFQSHTNYNKVKCKCKASLSGTDATSGSSLRCHYLLQPLVGWLHITSCIAQPEIMQMQIRGLFHSPPPAPLVALVPRKTLILHVGSFVTTSIFPEKQTASTNRPPIPKQAMTDFYLWCKQSVNSFAVYSRLFTLCRTPRATVTLSVLAGSWRTSKVCFSFREPISKPW